MALRPAVPTPAAGTAGRLARGCGPGRSGHPRSGQARPSALAVRPRRHALTEDRLHGLGGDHARVAERADVLHHDRRELLEVLLLEAERPERLGDPEVRAEP